MSRPSVLIALRNGAPWVLDALDSVKAQELTPESILVCDDRSTDEGPAMVREAHPDVRWVRSDRAGPVAARNALISACETPTLAFLDQDDLWHPAHLSQTAQALVDRPQAVAASSSHRAFLDGQTPTWPAAAVEVVGIDPWRDFPLGCQRLLPSAVLMRRAAVQRAGGFLEAFTGIGDEVLWLHLACEGELLHISRTTVARRLHPSSQSASLRAQGLPYLALHLRAMQHCATLGGSSASCRAQASVRVAMLDSAVRLFSALAKDRATRQHVNHFEHNIAQAGFPFEAIFAWWVRAHARGWGGRSAARSHAAFLLRLYARWPMPCASRRAIGDYLAKTATTTPASLFARGQWRSARRLRRVRREATRTL